jgi:hypothetical protein
MTTSKWIRGASLVLAVVGMTARGTVLTRAQNAVPPDATRAQGQAAAEAKAAVSPATLKITVIISRYRGDKKVGNLPYTFFIGAAGDRVSLRMGSQVPVPSTTKHENGTITTSTSYQPVGTNFDATARTMSDGKYSLSLTISDTQMMQADGSAQPSALRESPLIQTFNSVNNLYLRDGQTVQFTTATDKVTGEVVKVDVTLEVVK